jgi:uncharacterized protein involved in response to NO
LLVSRKQRLIIRKPFLIRRCRVAMPAVQTARSEPFAIWTLAFRLFFLEASVWSAAALTGWVATLTRHAAQRAGATPEELMEAVWVAAEMRAGGAFAHSALMLTALKAAET